MTGRPSGWRWPVDAPEGGPGSGCTWQTAEPDSALPEFEAHETSRQELVQAFQVKSLSRLANLEWAIRFWELALAAGKEPVNLP